MTTSLAHCRFVFDRQEVSYRQFQDLVQNQLILSTLAQMVEAAQQGFGRLYCPEHGRGTTLIIAMTSAGELAIKADFCCPQVVVPTTAPFDHEAEAAPSTDRIEGAHMKLQVAGVEEPFVFDANRIDTISIGRDIGGNSTTALDLKALGGQDQGISRQHATIVREGGAFFLMDNGSTNGTVLNGARLAPHKLYLLEDDNKIRFGQLRVTLSLVSPAGERRPPAANNMRPASHSARAL